jgi:membrane protein
MQASLNEIWKVQPQPVSLSTLVRARAASLGLVAALGFLLLVSLAASAAISSLSELINSYLPFGTFLLSLINTIVSVLLLSVLFGAIYKVLPDRSLAWRDVRTGALITAILFTAGKSLIGWYLGTSAVASSYGAAGSLIVLLLWVFYSSATFLFGAEVTRAYATSWGSRTDLRVAAELPGLVGVQPQRKAGTRGAIAIAGLSIVAVFTAALASAFFDRDHHAGKNGT